MNPQHVCPGLTGCRKTHPGWADMDSLSQVKPVLDKWAHVAFLDRSLLLSSVSRIHYDNESSILIPVWGGNPQVGFRGRRANKAQRQHPTIIKQEKKNVARYHRPTNLQVVHKYGRKDKSSTYLFHGRPLWSRCSWVSLGKSQEIQETELFRSSQKRSLRK